MEGDVNENCSINACIYITCANVSFVRGNRSFRHLLQCYTFSSFCFDHFSLPGRFVIIHFPAVSWHAHLRPTIRKFDIRPRLTAETSHGTGKLTSIMLTCTGIRSLFTTSREKLIKKFLVPVVSNEIFLHYKFNMSNLYDIRIGHNTTWLSPIIFYERSY